VKPLPPFWFGIGPCAVLGRQVGIESDCRFGSACWSRCRFGSANVKTQPFGVGKCKPFWFGRLKPLPFWVGRLSGKTWYCITDWNGITVLVESFNLPTKIARHRKAATVAYVMGDADKVLQAAYDDTATEVRFIDIGERRTSIKTVRRRHYDQNLQNI